MNDKQLGVLYTIMLTIWLVIILGLSHLLDAPPQEIDHAQSLCQELYGPQVESIVVDKLIKCQTVRGEILDFKHPGSS
jgi:hypothetical protein